jgi:hypothetical protein
MQRTLDGSNQCSAVFEIVPLFNCQHKHVMTAAILSDNIGDVRAGGKGGV